VRAAATIIYRLPAIFEFYFSPKRDHTLAADSRQLLLKRHPQLPLIVIEKALLCTLGPNSDLAETDLILTDSTLE
jgi:hypothetical protein